MMEAMSEPPPSAPPAPAPPPATVEYGGVRAPGVRGFALIVAEGAPAATWRSRGPRATVGSHPGNDLVLADATVSRFHCELTVEGEVVRVRDLGSRNGTVVDGVRVHDGFVRDGSVLRLGRAAVRVELTADHHPLLVSASERFGGLAGVSVAMRATFALLERAAATDANVLLQGETGTGKGAMADAIHAQHARRDRPLVVVDCGALSPTLLDSELFGHERGAFTGADTRRVGAFEEADGGTIFLDEIGELPADLQPKLLRVLENREVRRLGQNAWRPVDFRLIAATNRDLRAEVNAGRFRADLFYRLAVLEIPVPPLRARPEDIPAIAAQILTSLGASAEERAAMSTPEVEARLLGAAWPGNVRELRNYLERSLVLQTAAPLAAAVGPEAGAGTGAGTAAGAGIGAALAGASGPDLSLAYADARRRAVDQFERDYVAGLLRAHDGKVAAAARTAGVARVYLYRLMRKHGLGG